MPAQTVRFLSELPALRIHRKTTVEHILPTGNVVTAEPEVVYQFQHGALELRVGQDMLADAVDPQTGEVTEQDAVDYVRQQIATTEVGQWVIEVERVAPDPTGTLQEIAVASATGNGQRLEEIRQAELAEWNRPAVLDAISQIEAAVAPPEKAPAG